MAYLGPWWWGRRCIPKPQSAQGRTQVQPQSDQWEPLRWDGRSTPGSITVTFSSAPTVLGASNLLLSGRPKPYSSASQGLRLIDRNPTRLAAPQPGLGIGQL